jgi:hypothetical protein
MLSVAGVAQSVEQHIRNVWVGGSIPPIGLIKSMYYDLTLATYLKFSQFCPISKKTPTINRNNCRQKWRV